jgi:serine phosphatase RsbU (regulator of sigma subunit)
MDVKAASNDSLKCAALYQLGRYQFLMLRDVATSSNNLFKALELAERNNLKEIQARCYDVLAWMESRKENHYKAVQYAEKAAAYYKTTNSDYYLFKADYNLGCMLLETDKQRAEVHLNLSLELARKVDKKNWTLNVLQALGDLYKEQDKVEKGLQHVLEAADIMFELKKNYGNGRIPGSIAELYAKTSNNEKVDYWMEQAFICAHRVNDKMIFKEIYQTDFGLKKQQGKAKEALDSYEKYILYKDSIFNEEALAASTNAENHYLNDLEILKEEKHAAEKKLAASEQKRAAAQKRWMIGFIIIVLIALVVMIQRFIVAKKQKTLIQHQKIEVDEKNREIMDSINYARRIQSAILPPDKIVKEYLRNSFILYQPKDVVAGDFYWLEHKEGIILFAAADCTGHGVPGAMVSVVCNNALNRSVREHGITDPGLILDKSREIVTAEFEKSDEEVKDGMDIALCTLNGDKLAYSGANNPLWIIRNGEVLETKADKQPIGKYADLKPFTTHHIQLKKGDTIYIFSDGFVDQFGGEKGKKFKPKAFKELLLSIQNTSMEEQKDIINNTFENWKGDLEQVDDICVIGVRV